MHRTFRRFLPFFVIVLSAIVTGNAQTETSPLPLKRVTLYKHGVGYFERQGSVTGNQQLTFLFDAAQMNDVLKSLVVLDLGRGNITSVTFDSTKPFNKRIEGFGIRLEGNDRAGMTSLLGQLKGARVEVRSGAAALTGSIVGIEKRSRTQGTEQIEFNELVLITEGGELRSVPLDQIRGIRILEAKVREDLDRYLSILRSSIHKNLRQLTISTTGNGERDMFLSYVVEAPVWKATYRIVIDQKAKPFLQGWALVDNVQDEDWTNVTLSLIAGAPVSFIQDLQQPRYRSRPVVGLPDDVSVMPTVPQTSMGFGIGGGVGRGRGGDASIEGTVTDAGGAAIPNVTIVAVNNVTGQQSSAVTDSDGDYSLGGLSPGTYQITADAAGFKKSIVYGISVEPGMTAEGDVTLEVGSISETVTISASEASVVPSKMPVNNRRVMNLAMLTPGAAMRGDSSGVVAAAETQEIGELFEYRISHPVTIKRNSSALIPILQKTIEGETVSLYNRSTRESNPMSAVYLTNNTGLTLESGPVTVIENDTYAGEALTGRIRPDEKRFITYAVDLGCRVSVKTPEPDERTFLTQFINGELRVHYRQSKQTIYSLDNITDRPKTVFIEHPYDKNSKWKLTGDDKPFETTEDYHRFKVTVPPNTSTDLTVAEELPETTAFALSNVTTNDIQLYVRADYLSPEMKLALDEIVELKAQISALNRQVSAKGAEITAITKDQERMRENLKALGKTEEEKRLVQRYVNRIAEDEDRMEKLQAEVKSLNEEKAALQQRIDGRLRGLALEKRMN